MSKSTRTRKKIGSVLIRFLPEKNQWRASFRDHEGNYVRRMLSTSNPDEAEIMASEINTALLHKRGYLPPVKSSGDGDIRAAFERAFHSSNANPESRRDYVNLGNAFLKWLEVAYPNIKTWDELRPEHLSDYRLYCEREGLAYDTRRKRLFVLKRTSRFMAYNEPARYRIIAADLRLPQDDDPEVHCLTQAQLDGYLVFMREQHPDIYPVVVLQALAGLRRREAINLREQDVNLTKNTVKIARTPRHKPKNRSSRREIPIAQQVAEALRAARREEKIVDPDSYVLKHSRGEAWSMYSVSRKIVRSLHEYAGKTKDMTFDSFHPRWLRATFVTLLRNFKVDHRILQAYIGHSRGDVMGKHYEAVSIDKMRVEIVRTIEMRIGKEDELLQSNCNTQP